VEYGVYRSNEDVAAYNAAAARVGVLCGVVVHDLHAVAAAADAHSSGADPGKANSPAVTGPWLKL
jgi:hypothetical protein